MAEDIEITMKDVETALKVINLFLKRYRETTRLLSQLRAFTGRTGYTPFTLESITQSLLQETLAKRGQAAAPEPVEDETISEDELKKMREIAKKIEDKKVSV